jgi:tRNA threonylcarbamoyladenosine biosynthesis protein TsaB
VLALDTASQWCSVALALDGQCLERAAEAERGHGDQALALVGSLLAEAGCKLASLDAIAFGRGPGAFTGLRLAASLAQGLAWSSGLPIIPVSNLRAVAQQAIAPGPGGAAWPAAIRVLACQDARMGEAYWAGFIEQHGLAVPATAEAVQSPAALAAAAVAWLQAGPGSQPGAGGRLAAGSALQAYPELGSLLGGHCQLLAPLPPPAGAIALLAAAGGLAAALPPEQALPVYVRDDVARPPASA